MIVQVPGTSANLGPGFDCFGIAWNCYNTMEFLPAESLEISGCPEEFQNRENLAYVGYETVCRAAGVNAEAVSIRFLETEVPVSRGLGSSAALIAAGAVAANEMHGLGYTKEELLSLVTPVEGHPDNLAPALLGGLTVSLMEGERVESRRFPLSEKFFFAALIPNFKLSTALARGVLPEHYSRADAIFNVSRATLLLRALSDGDGDLLSLAMQDKIHQPYRFQLIEGYERAAELAKEQGALAVSISGAGSTLLCVAEDGAFGENMTRVLGKEFPHWQVRPLLVDMDGAKVL